VNVQRYAELNSCTGTYRRVDKEGLQDAILELAGDGPTALRVGPIHVSTSSEARDQNVLVLPLIVFVVGRVNSTLPGDLLNVEVELGNLLDQSSVHSLPVELLVRGALSRRAVKELVQFVEWHLLRRRA
jgi:hypothetical protein